MVLSLLKYCTQYNMATRLYHVDKGGNYRSITQEAGSATTNGVELTVDLAKLASKKDVLLALDALKVYITSHVWKPA